MSLVGKLVKCAAQEAKAFAKARKPKFTGADITKAAQDVNALKRKMAPNRKPIVSTSSKLLETKKIPQGHQAIKPEVSSTTAESLRSDTFTKGEANSKGAYFGRLQLLDDLNGILGIA